MQRCPVIDRARAELGWEPTVALEAGLARTIAYFDGEMRRGAIA
jgi:UDP-glucuronate decarboxylase